MRTLHAVSLVAVIAPFISAQQIVPSSGTSTFPACAVGCPVLINAQTVCTPPKAIVATQETYDNCFCLVPTLVDLYTTGETLCTDQCTTTADRQQLSTWFVAFCQQAGSSFNGASTSASASVSQSTASTVSSSTASTSSAEPTRSATTYNLASSDNGPWIKTHWPWVIMLVILFVGLLAIGFGARWWKKRHDHKAELRKTEMLNFSPPKEDGLDKEGAYSLDSWNNRTSTYTTKGNQYTQNGSLPIISEHQDLDNAGKQDNEKDAKVAVAEIDPTPPLARTRYA